MDTSANVQDRYLYQPFGELHENDPADFDENVTACGSFRFTGQWHDDEIGLYHLRARMYDPHLGRFTTRDPVKGYFTEPMTLHQYLYCMNDPVNRVDPQGEISVSDLATSMTIGAIIGGLTSIPQSLASGDYRDIVVGAAGGAVTGLVLPWFSGYGLLAKGFGSAMGSAAGTITQEQINRTWLEKQSEYFMANVLTSAVLGGIFGSIGEHLGTSMAYRDALHKGLSGKALELYMQKMASWYLTTLGVEAQWISEIFWQGGTGEWQQD